MIWQFLRYLISFTLPAFYRRIGSRNMDAIKKHKGPAILAMNHPNAFIDPIAITWDLFPVRTHYMARGDAFKPGLITFLLNQIGIIPIYRLRDGGKEGLLKNDDSYVAVNKLLAKNAKVIVYAEGLCIQERRLRPLKKGVARMVFGSFEAIKRDDLVVFPVGLNYSQPDKLRSDIFYNVGEPIRVADYLEDYKENQTKTYNKFLKHLTTEMKKLVTHIDDPINDKLVVNLETMFTYSYIKWNKQLDNLENRFNFTLRLTKTINKAQKNNPELTEDLRLKTAGYFKQLRVHNLRDWIIDPARKSLSKIYLLFFSLVMIVLLPFHVFGLIGNIAPYKLTEYLTKKAVKKNKEFYSSMAIGIGTFTFFIFYIIWANILNYLLPNSFFSLGVLVFILICGYLSIEYQFYIKKLFGLYKAHRNQKMITNLKSQRAEIESIISSLT